MKVDEALELVEAVLDYRCLNKIQETVFRQTWDGKSYQEIAANTGYEPDYVKDVGAKLWKLLSEAFGEKIKKDTLKSVLKKYLHNSQINIQRQLVIELNLNGADLSGLNLSSSRLVANLISSNIDDIYLKNKNHKSPIEAVSEKKYKWHEISFARPEKAELAEILYRLGIAFIADAKLWESDQVNLVNYGIDFLIFFFQSKSGVLNFKSDEDTKPSMDYQKLIDSGKINYYAEYDLMVYAEKLEEVVHNFLATLAGS
ncbi:hypothetical protein [Arthrospira platensis]|uniref:hypothetical protein n=2 Tax=Oscillatoriophycideae TaxID=1301283 RepID=UPI0001C38B7B|nr:hypothetical protein [Arthrospira platensis]KDR58935.1 hypothetical protein APPUASWS_002135 [Arthrospira platensis str. Paraca]MDT9293735.1 hypothetical protein [Arthrospira platensis PCC 7345]MDT9309043.1 hypothetical protein [Limnospira sp. Paracas R14]QQW29142.2 hypothetical protein AP9108_31070 [Arthrospira sp. PCC 9108]